MNLNLPLSALLLFAAACKPTQALSTDQNSEYGPVTPVTRAVAESAQEGTPGTPSQAERTLPDLSSGSLGPSQSVDGCIAGSASKPMPSEVAAAVPPERQNVLGTSLTTCSTEPLTGWFRDGFCRTDERDRGIHVVCAVVDETFLAFTKQRGNDLSTPRHGFPGLKSGDRWCLCAARWYQAQRAGKAPSVVLSASHTKALTVVPMTVLQKHRHQPDSK